MDVITCDGNEQLVIGRKKQSRPEVSEQCFFDEWNDVLFGKNIRVRFWLTDLAKKAEMKLSVAPSPAIRFSKSFITI